MRQTKLQKKMRKLEKRRKKLQKEIAETLGLPMSAVTVDVYAHSHYTNNGNRDVAARLIEECGYRINARGNLSVRNYSEYNRGIIVFVEKKFDR